VESQRGGRILGQSYLTICEDVNGRTFVVGLYSRILRWVLSVTKIYIFLFVKVESKLGGWILAQSYLTTCEDVGGGAFAVGLCSRILRWDLGVTKICILVTWP
jgi:hypothetical protein